MKRLALIFAGVAFAASAQAQTKSRINDYPTLSSVPQNSYMLLQAGPTDTAPYVRVPLSQLPQLLQPQTWTTSGRPTNPTAGEWGYNLTNQSLEAFVNGTWVALSTATPPDAAIIAPSAPTNVQIGTPSTSSFPVTWVAPTTGTSPQYQLLTAPCGSTAFAPYGGLINATTATVSGLAAGVCEQVEVQATNASGKVATSAPAQATTLAAAPGVAVLQQNLLTATSVGLVVAVPAGTTPMTLQPQEQSGNSWTNVGTVLTSTAAAGTTLAETVTGLSASTGYTFRFLVTNNVTSTPSATLTVTTPAAATVAPGAATGLTAGTITSSSIAFSWTDSTTGTPPLLDEVDYQVQGAGSWTAFATGITAQKVTVTGLTSSTPYNLRVITSNGTTPATSATLSATTSAGASVATSSCTGSQSAGTDPAITAPSSCTVVEGTTLAIPGVSASTAATQFCGSLDSGTTAGTSAMTVNGSPVSGSGTTSISYCAALAGINTAAGTLTYTAPSSLTSDSLVLAYYAPTGASTSVTVPITVVSPSSAPTGGGGPAVSSVPTDATGTQAVAAARVWGGLGVDTHLDQCCGGLYGNVSGVIADLNYLGVKIARDYWENDSLNTIAATVSQQTGVRWFATTGEGNTFAADLARMRSFQASCHCVAGYEGANEPDSSYSGGNGESIAEAQSFQSSVYAAAQADGVQAGAMSLLMTDAGSNYLNDYNQAAGTGYATLGNAHTYPQEAPTTRGAPGYNGTLDWITQGALLVTPGKPIVDTEYGWRVPPDTGYGEVSTTAAEKYGLEFVFDAWNAGHTYYIRYGLFDDVSGDYGIFDGNNNPRPEAVGYHNLGQLLSDTASNATTFSPGKLNFSLSHPAGYGGSTSKSGIQYTLMQKAMNGYFDLAIWNEQDIDSPGSTTDATIAAVSETITFGSAMTSVDVFDPVANTTTHVCSSCSSATVSVPAYPVIVQIQHP